MAKITFDDDKKTLLTSKVKTYFDAELGQDIGEFEAEFLIDFFIDEIGKELYNQGVKDAQALLSKKVDDILDSFYDLEK